MHPDPDSDSSSSSSSGTDTPGCSWPPPPPSPPPPPPPPPGSSSSPAGSAKGTAGFILTVSTSSGSSSMVQPTAALPSSSRLRSRSSIRSSSGGVNQATGTKSSSRKGLKEKASKEEEERRRIRRERNKIAAARCRNRRRQLIDTLQAETDQLEEEKSALQTEIQELLQEQQRLEQLLASHQSTCKMAHTADNHMDDRKPAEGGAALGDAPCIPAAAILGNCDILLCSSAEEEPMEELQGDDLDDLVPSLEVAAASVPDIDLSGQFCLPDWETLYQSVANDFESLNTPLMSSSPACSSYRTAFSFSSSDVASLAEGCEGLKSDPLKDSLHSPTLLAL